ncbi:MAG: hypothetical protein Q4C84_04515 [Bacillota bacterium]|nr:hypothetical protein [Bacillota bacterium]
MNKELPKILTVSINAWRDNSGINTLTGILSGWDKEKVAQVYMRAALPSTSVCEKFFQISEGRMIHSVLKRRTQTGIEVKNQLSKDITGDEEKEKERYNNRKKIPAILYTWARECVWKFGKWKTEELENFLNSYNPDVLFIPIYPTIYMGRIQKYIMEYTKKPVVSYIADDNYSYLACKKDPLSLLHRFFLRKYVKYIMKHSDQVFVIAPKQKEEYDKIFGIDSKILTKGLDYSQICYQEFKVHSPIKMVYTGKLIIGRWKSLALIADALGKINREQIKMELDIYTTDTITAQQEKDLNKNGCQIKGALTQQQVRKVQQEADILVFVESLEKKYRNTARLSFSTKITDYLSSGKCIFAIGSSEIAPIDYFRRYDSAVTAASEKEVLQKLQMLVENPKMITEYGKKGFECGKEHHEKDKMQKVFCNAVCNLKES